MTLFSVLLSQRTECGSGSARTCPIDSTKWLTSRRRVSFARVALASATGRCEGLVVARQRADPAAAARAEDVVERLGLRPRWPRPSRRRGHRGPYHALSAKPRT